MAIRAMRYASCPTKPKMGQNQVQLSPKWDKNRYYAIHATCKRMPYRVPLGVDVGDLFQLERAFEGYREVETATQEEHVLRVTEELRRGATQHLTMIY